MSTDFFSTSFLFSVLIIMLVAGIFVYVNYKMSEQDHKLSSMVSLVSMLAQDLQFVKNKVNVNQTHVESNSNNLQYSSQMVSHGGSVGLIDVSDGEDDKEDDDDEDEEEDDIDEEDDMDEEDEEDEEDDDDEEDDEQNNETHKHIQLLNLTLVNNVVDDVFDNDLQIEEIDIDNSSNIDDIKTIHIEDKIDIIDNENLTETKENNTNNDNLSFLKNVSITDLGDIQDFLDSKQEYKKMSLNKLREFIVSKGIISDASKLKKNEILKMLGDD